MPPDPCHIRCREVFSAPAHDTVAIKRNWRESYLLGDQNELSILRRGPQDGRKGYNFIACQYRDHAIRMLKEQRDSFLIRRHRDDHRRVTGKEVVEPFNR